MIKLQRSGFSTSKLCEVPGTTASSPSADSVHLDRVLQADFVIIADHDQRAWRDFARHPGPLAGKPGRSHLGQSRGSYLRHAIGCALKTPQ
jgi:hypothetical protein